MPGCTTFNMKFQLFSEWILRGDEGRAYPLSPSQFVNASAVALGSVHPFSSTIYTSSSKYELNVKSYSNFLYGILIIFYV